MYLDEQLDSIASLKHLLTCLAKNLQAEIYLLFADGQWRDDTDGLEGPCSEQQHVVLKGSLCDLLCAARSPLAAHLHTYLYHCQPAR